MKLALLPFLLLALASVRADDTCLREEDDFDDCLANELTVNGSNNCEACLINAVSRAVEQDGCTMMETTICNGIRNCGCDSCADEAEKYLDCLVDSIGTCNINCDLQTAKEDTTPTEPTSSAESVAGLAAAAVGMTMGLVM